MKSILLLALVPILGCNPPTSALPQPSEVVVVDADFSLVRIRHQEPISYFQEKAKTLGIIGNVAVEIIINPTGTPTSAKAIFGPKELYRVSEVSAMKMRFDPILVKGVPQYARFKFVFSYRP